MDSTMHNDDLRWLFLSAAFVILMVVMASVHGWTRWAMLPVALVASAIFINETTRDKP